MYRGFDLSLIWSKEEDFAKYVPVGESIYEEMKAKISDSLDVYSFSDKSLDGSKIQEEWFPLIEADIFISHSHKDKRLALFLAGWLKEKFGLIAFIDSCVWGYSNDLLKKIDDKYSWTDITKKTYSYDKRNYSNSHVHMILVTALNMMMDKTECLFFLNTPKSMEIYENRPTTDSPWIFTEIVLSKTLRSNIPARKLKLIENIEIKLSEQEPLKVRYNLDLSHLKKISTSQIFGDWQKNKENFRNKFDALDELYKL